MIKVLYYTSILTSKLIPVPIPVIVYGDCRGNQPQKVDCRQWKEIPEEYELLESYEGWTEGSILFLAPKGCWFHCIEKGSQHYVGKWVCKEN